MGATMMTLLILLAVAVAVLWIFMPFAVFGIKDLARKLIQQQRETNQLLQKLIEQNNKQP
jgi:predicted PurR-regulated permease PerM